MFAVPLEDLLVGLLRRGDIPEASLLHVPEAYEKRELGVDVRTVARRVELRLEQVGQLRVSPGLS